MKNNAKVIVRNEFLDFVYLYLEPWGEDYGMFPNDEFEIIAKPEDESFYFQIDFGKDIKIWAEGVMPQQKVIP